MTHKEQVIQKIDDFKHFFIELNQDVKGKNAKEIFNDYFEEIPELRVYEENFEKHYYYKRNFRLKIDTRKYLPKFFQSFLENLKNQSVGE